MNVQYSQKYLALLCVDRIIKNAIINTREKIALRSLKTTSFKKMLKNNNSNYYYCIWFQHG